MTKDLTLADELERLAKEATDALGSDSPAGFAAVNAWNALAEWSLENAPQILSALRGECPDLDWHKRVAEIVDAAAADQQLAELSPQARMMFALNLRRMLLASPSPSPERTDG